MNHDWKVELIEKLIEIQETSAPITIQIGSAETGHCDNDCVVIRDAPPIVLTKIVGDDYYCSVTKEGVHVTERHCNNKSN